jgi:hypothetical protein
MENASALNASLPAGIATQLLFCPLQGAGEGFGKPSNLTYTSPAEPAAIADIFGAT